MTTRELKMSKFGFMAAVFLSFAIMFIPAVAFAESNSDCADEEELVCEASHEETTTEDPDSSTSEEQCDPPQEEPLDEEEQTDADTESTECETADDQEIDDAEAQETVECSENCADEEELVCEASHEETPTEDPDSSTSEEQCDPPQEEPLDEEEQTDADTESTECETADEEGGQTYTTELTPDVVVGTDQDTQFTLKIEEVGDSNIAKVIIEGNDFDIKSLDELLSSCGTWDITDHEIAGNILTIWGSTLAKYEWVTAIFTATTPSDPGIHSFDVDVEDEHGISNNPETPGEDNKPSVWVAGKNCDVYDGESIQDAIDAANPFDIIRVHPGTYEEQLVINKDIQLIGEGNPVVQAPDTPVMYSLEENDTVTWEPVVFAFGGDLDDVTKLVSGAATIHFVFTGFTVDGNSLAPVANRSAGILLRNVNPGTISHNTVQNMALGGRETFGIIAYGDCVLNISNNNISEFQRGGIGLSGNLDGTGPYADITGNTVTAPPASSGWAANGIQIGWGASGTIMNNIVCCSAVVSDDWAASGILISGSSDVLIAGNTVCNSDIGIGVAGYLGYLGGNHSSGNIIDGNTLYSNSYSIYISGDVSDTLITGNEVYDSYVGIISFDFRPSHWSGGGVPVNTIVTANSIYDNDYGLYIYEPFSENTPVPEGFVVDARNNWWGHETGPLADSNPEGLGNFVGLEPWVIFDPWLDADPTIVIPPVPEPDVEPEPEEPAVINLIFGQPPIITVDFVFDCCRDMLSGLRNAYSKILQAFEDEKDELSDHAYAIRKIELSVAWAVIQAVQARLYAESGLSFDLALLIEAYDDALAALEEYGGYFNTIQMDRVTKILDAVAEIISNLSS